MSNAYLCVQKVTHTKIDMHALNADLASNTGVGELLDYRDIPSGVGFFSDAWTILNRETGKHEKQVNVYACFGEEEMQTIARHLKDGEIILRYTAQGWDPEYYRITPNAVDAIDPFAW